VSSDWRADGVSICSDGREDESRDDIQREERLDRVL
jgi:hypothetical protein